MRIPRVARGLVTAVLVVLVVASCSSGDDDPSDDGEGSGPPVLRVGAVGEIVLDTADVQPTPSELMVVDLLFDGLTAADPETNEVEPGLAEWEVNDELDEWTFTLDEGATFGDGSPVTAADAKFSLERIAAPGDLSLRGVRLEIIEGYPEFIADAEGGELSGLEVVDDRTLRVSSSEPYAELPAVLSDPVFGIVPETAVEAEGRFATAPVGSGPFSFVSMDESRIVLERTPGRDTAVEGVEVFLFGSAGDSFSSFEAGDLDVSPVPTDSVGVAAGEYGSDHFADFFAELYFAMNLADEAFEDAGVRHAVALAIDREAIVEEFFPAQSLLDGLIPLGVPGSRPGACGDSCAFDADRARELLAEAVGDGGPPSIALDFSEEDFPEAAAEEMEAMLEDAGFEVELRPTPLEEYREFVLRGDQQLFQFGWVGVGASPGSYLGPLFLTDSGDNVTGFSNEVVDAGIATARATADDGERIEAYQAVEDAVLESFVVVPLVQVRNHLVAGDRVEDLAVGVDGTIDGESVSVG